MLYCIEKWQEAYEMEQIREKNPFEGRAMFAASNGAGGFKSYYDQVFDREELERLYIIKGGPGTGKSRFMHIVAKFSEELGFGVEYYNCSSDPDSLDGLKIDGRIALVDGTYPHVEEPKIVGARDEIINFGAFWNAEALAERYCEISELCDKKTRAYQRGYRYLTGCGELAEINRALVFDAVKSEKLMKYVSRLVFAMPSGEYSCIVPAICDSVGMKGRVRYDVYEKCAEKLYYVIDWYSSAHLFISAVITCAQRNNIPLRVSYDPINTDRPDCVYFCNSGVAFVVCEPCDADRSLGELINMKRFLDTEKLDRIKKEYRYNVKLYDALLSSACDSFGEAGDAHFALEEIYSSCMDFSAKEKFTLSFCEMLRRELTKKK